MTASDEAIAAARKAADEYGISDPYGARVQDYPNRVDLRRADEQAERQNVEAWRAVIDAALEAMNRKD